MSGLDTHLHSHVSLNKSFILICMYLYPNLNLLTRYGFDDGAKHFRYVSSIKFVYISGLDIVSHSYILMLGDIQSNWYYEASYNLISLGILKSIDDLCVSG